MRYFPVNNFLVLCNETLLLTAHNIIEPQNVLFNNVTFC